MIDMKQFTTSKAFSFCFNVRWSHKLPEADAKLTMDSTWLLTSSSGIPLYSRSNFNPESRS